MKKYLAILAFVGLASWVSLGLFTLSHHHTSSTTSDCPISSLHIVDCPENVSAMVVHHFLAYQSILNSFIFTSVVQVLAVFGIVIVFIFRNYLASIRYLSLLFDSRRQYGKYAASSRGSLAVARWLSLLIHSPSLN